MLVLTFLSVAFAQSVPNFEIDASILIGNCSINAKTYPDLLESERQAVAAACVLTDYFARRAWEQALAARWTRLHPSATPPPVKAKVSVGGRPLREPNGTEPIETNSGWFTPYSAPWILQCGMLQDLGYPCPLPGEPEQNNVSAKDSGGICRP